MEGIRAYHFARELARVFPTTLIARFEDFDGAGEHFTPVDRSTLEARRGSVAARVVVGQPVREILAQEGKPLELCGSVLPP